MTDKASGPDGASLVERLRACLRFDEMNPSESHLEQLAREAALEIERLQSMIEYIGTSDRGGCELFPVGPLETEYSDDGNTVVRDIGPWRFLHGVGETFMGAVEDAMEKDESSRRWSRG